MKIQCLKALLGLAALLACGGVWAQECKVWFSDIDFGDYNPLDNQAKDATGGIKIECYNPNTQPHVAQVCIGLKEGSSGISIDNRQMLSSQSSLPYQLYQDAARTQIVGVDNNRILIMLPPISPGSSGSTERTIYARIPAGLQDTFPGGYGSKYIFPGQIVLGYKLYPPGINTLCDFPATVYPPDTVNDFAVVANVPDKCEVLAPEMLDFGTVTGLAVPELTAVAKMEVRCTRGTSHTIALDDGVFPKGPGWRRMRGPSGFIDYEIFQDPGQNIRWGMTPDGPTGLIMWPLTGEVQWQGYVIYGAVPAQTAPGMGTYEDKVIVTVEY